MTIQIKNKAIPSSPRSKNYPTGAIVSVSSGGGSGVTSNGSGSNVTILGKDDLRSATDLNVFSSLRTLFEIKSRIIAQDDDNTILSDDNTLSSLRTLAEILSRIIKSGDKTELSEENTLSAKRIINEIEERALSRLKDDKAAGHLTLEKGATSKELFEANNGLVVRKTEVFEPMLMSLLSEEFDDGIIEENEDVFIEELSIRAPGSASTLGELDNVDDEADSAVLGSLFVKGDNWESVPPVLSSLTDFDNMLMPVFHKVLGKWVFISVSSISGGVTPPVTLEMVLDTGLLDVNKLV